MTARITGVMNQKGGVGKTTTAVNLSDHLARRGRRVLLVDFDIQGHVSTSLGFEKADGLFRYFLIDEPIENVIVNARPNLDIIQSGKKTERVRYSILDRYDRNYVVATMLEPVMERYEYIIFDLAPGTDLLTIAALSAADYYLIPAKMDYLALDGVTEAIKTVSSLGAMENIEPPQLIGVLPTMFDRVTRETVSNVEIIKKVLGTGAEVLHPIPQDTLAREATKKGLTLAEYAEEAPALIGYEFDRNYHGGRNSRGRVGGYLHLGETVEAL